MDGIHDLGGKPGYGAVDREGEDQVFHDRWEAAVFAMAGVGAIAGAWTNTDRFRHAIERIDPDAYLNHGYYGRWLGAIETLLVEAGMLDRRDITDRAIKLGASADDLIASRTAEDPDPLGPPPEDAGSDRRLNRPPRFRTGDRVRTTGRPVPGHTRLPAYARGCCGEIIAWHDGWVFPDTSAHGQGEQPQHLYTVRFSSEELWNRKGFSVCLDLFEPYLSNEPDTEG